MFGQLSWAPQYTRGFPGAGIQFPRDGEQRLLMDHSRAQEPRGQHADIQNGGFDSNLALPAVHDEPNAVADLGRNVLGVGGGEAIGKIALGAANGKPQARISACMKGWPGQRTPTRVSRPP